MTAPSAPGTLELVRAFVNTRDLDLATDQLTSPAGWSAWAAAHDELPGSLTARDLAPVRDLREHLRAALIDNHDGAPMSASTAAALSDAAQWARLTVAFTPGGPQIRTHGTGPRRAAAALLGAVADAMHDDTWRRLKACGNSTCRWAFYDHSRSRTGSWCSMEACGNRIKQARWRARSALPESSSGSSVRAATSSTSRP